MVMKSNEDGGRDYVDSFDNLKMVSGRLLG